MDSNMLAFIIAAAMCLIIIMPAFGDRR